MIRDYSPHLTRDPSCDSDEVGDMFGLSYLDGNIITC